MPSFVLRASGFAEVFPAILAVPKLLHRPGHLLHSSGWILHRFGVHLWMTGRAGGGVSTTPTPRWSSLSRPRRRSVVEPPRPPVVEPVETSRRVPRPAPPPTGLLRPTPGPLTPPPRTPPDHHRRGPRHVRGDPDRVTAAHTPTAGLAHLVSTGSTSEPSRGTSDRVEVRNTRRGTTAIASAWSIRSTWCFESTTLMAGLWWESRRGARARIQGLSRGWRRLRTRSGPGAAPRESWRDSPATAMPGDPREPARRRAGMRLSA